MSLTELKIESSSPSIMSIDEDKVVFKINRKILSQITKTLKGGRKPFLISESNLHVKNISSNYIAVRVRATKKRFYYVDPTYVILSPGEVKNYRFLYFTNLKEEISSEGHKFKFEGFIIQQNEIELKDVFNLCQEYIKKEIKVKGNIFKLGVKFVDDNNYQLPKKNENTIIKKKTKKIGKDEKLNECDNKDKQDNRKDVNNDVNKDGKDKEKLKEKPKRVKFMEKKEESKEKLETVDDKIKENVVNKNLINQKLDDDKKKDKENSMNSTSEINKEVNKANDSRNLDPKNKIDSKTIVIIIGVLILLLGIRLIK